MKKNLQILVSVLAVVVLTLALSSCNLFGSKEQVCQHEWSEDYTINSEGHVFTCKLCGDKQVESHLMGTVETITASTCTVAGVGQRTCTICEEHQTEEPLALAAHVYEKGYTANESEHWRKCENCDAKIAIKAHSYLTPAHDAGYHWMTCECKAEGPKTAHDWDIQTHDNGTLTLTCKDSTCPAKRENVKDENHVCTMIPGAITKEPTCTETGTRALSCACGATSTESIPMIDHDFTSGSYKSDETHHWQSCSCGEAAGDADKVPHDFSGVPREESDFNIYTCICGKEKKEPKPGYIDPNGWT